MDHRQVLEIWPALPGVRLVCLDTRGHGLSDLGEPNAVSFQRAVRDVVELTTHLGEAPSIVGGISLGAALALELTKHLHVEHLIMSGLPFRLTAIPQTSPYLGPYVKYLKLNRRKGGLRLLSNGMSFKNSRRRLRVTKKHTDDFSITRDSMI